MSNNNENKPIDADAIVHLVVDTMTGWKLYEISSGKVKELELVNRVADGLLALVFAARTDAAERSAYLLQGGRVISHGPRETVTGILARVAMNHVREVLSLKEALRSVENRGAVVEIELKGRIAELQAQNAHAEDSKAAIVVGLSIAAVFALLLAGAALAAPTPMQDVAYIALSNGETLKVLL